MLLFGNIRKGLEEYRTVPNGMLVDVREPEEFADGHIPGAVNVPLSGIRSASLPMGRPMFLYCLRGSRSKRAAGILKRMGFSAKSIGGIRDYRGSIKK